MSESVANSLKHRWIFHRALPAIVIILSLGGLLCAEEGVLRAATSLPDPSSRAFVESPSPNPKIQSTTREPEALREKAIRYSRIQYVLYFGGVALALAIYAALWLSGFGAWLGGFAHSTSRRFFIQCLIFVPIFWAVTSAIQFPLDYYAGYIVEQRFDLSAQSFASWLRDWGKTFGLTVLVAVFAVWLLYRIIRARPRSWWVWFWLLTLPLVLFVMFVEPWIIEPLFYKYTPLERTDPALTARIEEMLHHAGIHIPESRIFEMNASAKTRTLNAYVSGIGQSKRVVVWDNTLRELTPDETLSVLAHETGHYVLHHVLKEFTLDELLALGCFFTGFLLAVAALRRWGARARIETLGDLASLPLLMLILTVIVFLASPIYCGISRHYEAQADQYGLELTYGVMPDPNTSMVRSFEIMGKDDLSDPDPNPFITFWLFTHPPLAERIDFARHYKPWTEGKPMKLLRKF